MSKKHRVSLEVKFFVDMLVPADDKETAVIQVEKFLAKCDDYDIVNRSHEKEVQISEVIRMYPEKENAWEE